MGTKEQKSALENKRRLEAGIKHVYGPSEMTCGEDEVVMCCLVRDGRPYVREFVEHHLSMGVKHIFFLENNSTDGTVEALCDLENVTVFRTEVRHEGPGEPRVPFKQYLVERFGSRGGWCLYADIDELFDYPYSDVVSLQALLRYMKARSYTVLPAQMLEMFPKEPLTGRMGMTDEPLKARHRFYDLENIARFRLRDLPGNRGNEIGNPNLEGTRGGILRSIFGTMPFRTKFPLVFLDGRLRPLDGGDGPSSHWVSGARVADITGVMLHYKFVDARFQQQAEQAVKEEHRLHASVMYKEYQRVLDEMPVLTVMRETSQELESIEDLIRGGLLTVSEDYLAFVAEEDRKSGLFPEAVLAYRRRERERALEIQRLRQQMRDERLGDRNRRRKMREGFEEDLQRVRKKRKQLARKTHSLEAKLEAFERSRLHRIASMLASLMERGYRHINRATKKK